MSLEQSIDSLFNEDPIAEGLRDWARSKPVRAAAMAGGMALAGMGAGNLPDMSSAFRDTGAQSSFSTSHTPHLSVDNRNLSSHNISYADVQDQDQEQDDQQGTQQDDPEPEKANGGTPTLDDYMDLIGPHEGYRAYVYDDLTGKRLHPGDSTAKPKSKRTVGYGFNMDQDAAQRRWVRAGGSDADFRAVRFGHQPIDRALAQVLFRQETIRSLRHVKRVIHDLESHPPQVQLALGDMAYNLGSLDGFPSMITAINSRDYEEAAWQMMHRGRDSGNAPSLWSTQVGQRAITLSDMVRSGAKTEPDNRAVESIFAPMPYIDESLAEPSKLGHDVVSILSREGSMSVRDLANTVFKSAPKEEKIALANNLEGTLRSLRKNGEIQVDQHGTVDLVECMFSKGPITESQSDHQEILDAMPRTERTLERQYLDAGEPSGDKGIDQVTVRYAVPKRVYRIFLNGKHIGWLDYRGDGKRSAHLAGEWEEPKGTIPDSRKDEMVAYLDRINKKRKNV